MKKSILVVLFLAASLIAFAQDSKFTEAMKTNIALLNQAKDLTEVQTAVNAFDRIAKAEPTRWEPLYYSAYGEIQKVFRESDVVKKDAYLDLADASIKKLKELKKNDSEINALDGFSTMIRLSIDPETRGQSYSGIAMQKLGTAVSLDSNNPRALLLQAQMQMGMAAFFGQDTNEPCAQARKADAMLDAAGTPADPLAPTWGKKMATKLLLQCK